MKVPLQQLANTLSRQLAPVYLVSGDEPYQRDEACRLVREYACKQGYEERTILHVERGFDWQDLLQAGNAMSLFSQKRLLELRMPTGKPGTEGAKALQAYCDALPEDTLLLIVTGKLDQAQQKTKWVQAISNAGVQVSVWPLEPARLPDWIRAALARREMQATPEAIRLLAERVEGNLLAADQELEKLRLLFGPGELDADQVRQAVSESARYDVFDLVDAALAGRADRVSRILFGLRAEGVEPILILWALAREIRSLATMSQAIQSGQSPDAVMSRQRVWDKRKPLVGKALSRLSVHRFPGLVASCSLLDHHIKGIGTGTSWNELLELALSVAGKPALVTH